MPPSTPRLRILSVGGNAVSAFLSWRLSATQACDVTLVWKNGFEQVHQYGISFKSSKFGNERFKPRHVVKSPEDAAGASRASFDYVLLCVKALPDVYDLASVIESVVSPQHTCILVNTTATLGIESYLEQRFPTNVVLSLVSGVQISQLGPSEFEHSGSSELWVGAANKNPSIPASIQTDMAEALSMTLKSGQVDCEVSVNIRQKQFERMIGPIAFYPASVLFETPSHAELLEKNGVRSLITGIIDELLTLARKTGCEFKPEFREQTMEQMIVPSETNSIMYQDFTARRPMEVETYLGSPIKLAQEVGVQIPRIETLYSILHHINVVNQSKPIGPPSPSAAPTPRMSSAPGPPNHGYGNGRPPPPAMNGRPMPPNGMRPGSRAPSLNGGPPRRGPPSMSGYPPPGRMNGNGYAPPRGPPLQRRASVENNDLEEFSHLMLYSDMAEDGAYENGLPPSASGDLTLRERELALRQKELALREREYHMRRGPGGGRGPRRTQEYDDDDDEDGLDFFDPMAAGATPVADVDNLDMMSVTSRRTRKAPSASQLRSNPEGLNGVPNAPPRHSRGMMRRPGPNARARTSAAIMADMPGLREELMNNPLMGYSSDRFGSVDRMNMGHESRANSLTAERLHEFQNGGPPHNGYPGGRRGSQSPGNPLGPGQRPPHGRPSPPNGYGGPPGRNGRPSPPGMSQPVPRHPPGHGNAVAPQHIEQQTGVSNLYPPKSGPPHQVRSLTGSASASAGSGDSNRSAPIDSEPSAHSSSSSLPPRPPIGVR
ncbi:Meiotically up-regulated 72 protein [Cercospora beticola]|uniref:Meiotically up-regulated 72 protein n=1 Tax=Cercospora beticola TaxID=122368 RepID=A0A2G5IAM5_CERBT|nr:Meiotically up-regulated 72 protein [Cercospora beticola]PIB01523.1 Meiotically up-regulated 72 protein [Cercospora beticola]CAK1354018.1 unnamed protein product [Cercospora beticola]